MPERTTRTEERIDAIREAAEEADPDYQVHVDEWPEDIDHKGKTTIYVAKGGQDFHIGLGARGGLKYAEYRTPRSGDGDFVKEEATVEEAFDRLLEEIRTPAAWYEDGDEN